MYIRPLKSPEDHTNALREIERLWGAPLDSPEGDKLDVLTTLVEAYQARHCPIPPADPVDVLHFAIDEMGRSQADLPGCSARGRGPRRFSTGAGRSRST